MGRTYVKSPVASLCFVCSSVRKRVKVTISVLIFGAATGAPTSPLPFVAIVYSPLNQSINPQNLTLKSRVFVNKGSSKEWKVQWRQWSSASRRQQQSGRGSGADAVHMARVGHAEQLSVMLISGGAQSPRHWGSHERARHDDGGAGANAGRLFLVLPTSPAARGCASPLHLDSQPSHAQDKSLIQAVAKSVELRPRPQQ
jgi:hypothetical protein